MRREFNLFRNLKNFFSGIGKNIKAVATPAKDKPVKVKFHRTIRTTCWRPETRYSRCKPSAQPLKLHAQVSR